MEKLVIKCLWIINCVQNKLIVLNTGCLFCHLSLSLDKKLLVALTFMRVKFYHENSLFFRFLVINYIRS